MRFKLLCCAALVLFSSGHSALAQPEPPQSMPIPPAKPADAGFEAAKAAFEALPQAERKAIQDALIWTGDYNGTVTGDFGRRTFEAISAYARRAGLLATGMLDPASRKTLLAAAQRAREAAKFTLARDAATGIRIGVPERVLVRREGNPSGGTRWQGANGKITLDTRAIAPGAGDLTSLFERNLSVQAPGRRVTYKLLRPDFFVVAGETPAGKFYTRYALGPARLARLLRQLRQEPRQRLRSHRPRHRQQFRPVSQRGPANRRRPPGHLQRGHPRHARPATSGRTCRERNRSQLSARCYDRDE